MNYIKSLLLSFCVVGLLFVVSLVLNGLWTPLTVPLVFSLFAGDANWIAEDGPNVGVIYYFLGFLFLGCAVYLCDINVCHRFRWHFRFAALLAVGYVISLFVIAGWFLYFGLLNQG